MVSAQSNAKMFIKWKVLELFNITRVTLQYSTKIATIRIAILHMEGKAPFLDLSNLIIMIFLISKRVLG